MPNDLKALYDEKGTIAKEMRDLDAKLTGEKRRMNSDEKTKWETWDARLDEINEVIQRSERLNALERDNDTSRREFKPDDDGRQPNDGKSELRSIEQYERNRRDLSEMPEDQRKTVESVQRRGFRNFLRRGLSGLSDIEQRALQMGTGPDGGYLVAPVAWMNDLIKAKDNQSFIRQLATKYTIAGAHSMGFPSLETDPDDSDWTSELGTGSLDSSMALGKRELKTNPLAKRLKVSKTLMRNSNIEALVSERLGYKMGITEEKAFLTGTGVQRPLGLFTASSDGISTGRDVSTNNTTSAIGADNLIDCKYTLKGQYWNRATWLFHRDAVKQIRKLKDSNNQYLWAPGLQQGQPDRILDLPFIVSEYVPNTFSASQYVGLLGDFSFYWILDSLDMEVQRLNELYAETNQVGFITRAETDGMPILEEAFVRVKLAAS